MKILVTGGAGFIGSHLCEKLLDVGHEVICVDNFLTGTAKNVAHLEGHAGFSFIQHDVIEPLDIACDVIVHLACPAAPAHYLQHPIKTLLVETVGTHRLLELAIKNNARFLLASSSEVYGDPAMHPQREDYWGNVNPIGSRSCYNEGKRAAEALCMAYVREKNVDVRIVRFFNIYGPRMQAHDGRAVPNFIAQALKNEPLTVYGDGSQTRSLCYIDDVIAALCTMIQKDGVGPDPINLGNPDEVTMLALAREIKELAGSSSELVFKPLPEDDPRRRCPDIIRAKNILNWSPQISRHNGLVKTIEWFRSHLT